MIVQQRKIPIKRSSKIFLRVSGLSRKSRKGLPPTIHRNLVVVSGLDSIEINFSVVTSIDENFFNTYILFFFAGFAELLSLAVGEPGF